PVGREPRRRLGHLHRGERRGLQAAVRVHRQDREDHAEDRPAEALAGGHQETARGGEGEGRPRLTSRGSWRAEPVLRLRPTSPGRSPRGDEREGRPDDRPRFASDFDEGPNRMSGYKYRALLLALLLVLVAYPVLRGPAGSPVLAKTLLTLMFLTGGWVVFT